jgi:serine/threonine protein phosphatase 1
MREIVITDIHGCYDELRALLSEVDFGPGDLIIGASDCVDKGPASAQVVKYLRQLADAGQLVHIKGNHEVKFLKFVARYRKDPESAMEHKSSREMLRTLSSLGDADLDWLSEAKLWHPVSGYPGIVMHAGVEPGLRSLPTTGKVKDSELGHFSQMIYCRYVRAGKMVRLGDEDDSCSFWADQYDGRFGHVFYGHQPWMQPVPRLTSNTSGLDLGCVMGGRLAAAVIEGGKVHYASVPGADYVSARRQKENNEDLPIC